MLIRRTLYVFTFLLLLVITASGLGVYAISQQLKQFNIELHDWAVESISLSELRIKTLSFTHTAPNIIRPKPITDPLKKTYEPFKNIPAQETTVPQSVSRQHIRIKGLSLSWSDLTFNSFQPSVSLERLQIEALNIQLSSVFMPTSVNKPTLSTLTSPFIIWPETTRDWSTAPLTKNSRGLSPFIMAWGHQPLWPNHININQLQVTQPCSKGICQLAGDLTITLTPPSKDMAPANSLTGSPSLMITGEITPSIQLPKQLSTPNTSDTHLIYFKSTIGYINTLPTLQAKMTFGQKTHIQLDSHVTADNKIESLLTLTGAAPSSDLIAILQAWSKPLSSRATPQKSIQKRPVNLAHDKGQSGTTPWESIQNNPMALTLTHTIDTQSLGAILNRPLNWLNKVKSHLTSQLSAHFKLENPLPLPGGGFISGKMKTDIKITQGIIQHYLLQGEGRLSQLSHSELAGPLFALGLEIDELDYFIKSQNGQSPPKLSALSYLSAQPSASSSVNSPKLSKTLLTFPFDLSLFSNKTLKSTSDIEIRAIGDFSLDNAPAVNIQAGYLSLKQPKISLDQLISGTSHTLKTPRYILYNAAIKVPYKARYNHQTLEIKTEEVELLGTLEDREKQYTLRKGHLTLPSSQFTLSIPYHVATQFNSAMRNHNQGNHNQANWTFGAPSALLKGHFISPDIDIKDLKLKLTNPQLTHQLPKPTIQKKYATKPAVLKIHSRYTLSTSRLKNVHLLPQSWQAKGVVSGQVKNLYLSGEINNASELLLTHTSQIKAGQFNSHWTLPNHYLLAGNPIQKTFKAWPEALELTQGQLALKGDITLHNKLGGGQKEPNTTLSANLQLTAKGLTGIYQDTAFKQATTTLDFERSPKHFMVTIPNLTVNQLNQGVILGPLTLNARYSSQLDTPLQGQLTLNQFKTKLFNGQAWLKPQTMDLSTPFKTQLYLNSIDLKSLLKQYPSSDLSGSGHLSGQLPLQIDMTQSPISIHIIKGEISATSKGGLLRYRPKSKSTMAKTHSSMKTVLTVLDDFHYNVLNTNVSLNKDKTLLLGIQLKGHNPKVEKGRAINLNINLEEDLPALMTSMQISNQVNDAIRKRVQDRLSNP